MEKLILTVAAFLTVFTSAFAQLGSTDKDLVYTPPSPHVGFSTPDSPKAVQGLLQLLAPKTLLFGGKLLTQRKVARILIVVSRLEAIRQLWRSM